MKANYFRIICNMVAMEPIYDERGAKFSKIHCKDGTVHLFTNSIDKIKSDYCITFYRDITLMKNLSKVVLKRKTILPIKVETNITLMPIKTLKTPQNKDKCYSYILFEAIESIDRDTKTIYLKGNRYLTFLENFHTIVNRIGQCKILKSNITS